VSRHTSHAYRPLNLKRRAWLTLGAVVLDGGGVVSYAVASPSDGPSAADRAKRPVKVYDLALKGTLAGKRELPRTNTAQFSLVGVSWTGGAKRLDGTAQVRTRSLETGEWSAWRDLEVNVDPLEKPGPPLHPRFSYIGPRSYRRETATMCADVARSAVAGRRA
jgi:hypothetical protein